MLTFITDLWRRIPLPRKARKLVESAAVGGVLAVFIEVQSQWTQTFGDYWWAPVGASAVTLVIRTLQHEQDELNEGTAPTN